MLGGPQWILNPVHTLSIRLSSPVYNHSSVINLNTDSLVQNGVSLHRGTDELCCLQVIIDPFLVSLTLVVLGLSFTVRVFNFYQLQPQPV